MSIMRVFCGATESAAAALIFSCSFSVAASTQSDPPGEGLPVPRKILALYKGSENRTGENNEIYRLAQLPLNNLGLVVEYRDAEKTLPELRHMIQYRGVLSWFTNEQMKAAHRYRKWLAQMIEHRIPVVIAGHFGAYREFGRERTPADVRETKEILQMLGLSSDLRTWVNRQIQIVWQDSSFYPYEIPLRENRLTYATDIRSVDPANRVLLSLMHAGGRNDAVILSKWGAYLQTGTAYVLHEESGRSQWYINPFVFFGAVFRTDNLPIADINTVGGHRTAFIHIDGDGFRTISKIDRWHNCGQLLESRVLKKYSLPFSVSVIAADVDPKYLGTRETYEAARSIFKLANVEPASHSFSHPLDWRTGTVSFDSIPNYRFDPYREIVGSMEYIRSALLPPGKLLPIFFWSGAANPTAGQIRLVEDHGWLQLNGGAGRLDPELPSISAFSPPYVQVGDHFRINARISNEFEFTEGWRGPHDGFKRVIESLEFTEENGILTPADIYFHPYILEDKDGWESLRHVMEWAKRRDWTYVYASQYAQMVKDFLGSRIFGNSNGHFTIYTQGALRTIRFPNESGAVDMAQSENVLGFIRRKNELLVHLDAHTMHRVVVTDHAGTEPYLIDTTRLIDSLFVSGDSVRMFANGYGPMAATLANLRPGTPYTILSQPTSRVDPGIGTRRQDVAKTDSAGKLRLVAYLSGPSTFILFPDSSPAFTIHRLRMWLLGLVLLGYVAFRLRRMEAQDRDPETRRKLLG